MNARKRDSVNVAQTYVDAARHRLAACHEKLVHCLGQLDDAQVWWRPRESMNSVANLVLHLCGNLQQWFVSGIGGAPDVRNRPQEFAERGPVLRDELLALMQSVVAEAESVLEGIDEDRLTQPVRVQGFDVTVLAAIFDCLTHLAGHTQEVVYITRLQVGDTYRFAWAPTTPEQGALQESEAAPRTVAVTDAVFEEIPVDPLPPGLPAGTPPPPPAPNRSLTDEPGRNVEHESPLRDYLLELGQEFQDDEKRGKL